MTTDQIKAAAEVLLADYASQYTADHLTWRDFADLAASALEAASRSAALVSGSSDMLKAAPVGASELRVRVVIEDDGGNDLWWFYPIRPVRLGDHVHIDFDVKTLT